MIISNNLVQLYLRIPKTRCILILLSDLPVRCKSTFGGDSMKLLALALFAATLSAAPIVNATTTDLGGGVWNYSYEFDADPGETTNSLAVILPWVGTPDYLPLNIAMPNNWVMTRGACSHPPEVLAGTGCWGAQGPHEQTGTVSFDTGYAPVSGYLVVGTSAPGSGFAIVADVPNYDNTAI